jgi:hypothetical protein
LGAWICDRALDDGREVNPRRSAMNLKKAFDPGCNLVH